MPFLVSSRPTYKLATTSRVGKQRQVLIYGGDAEVEGIVGIVDGCWLATHDNLTGVGPMRAGNHLDQRRLSRAVVAYERDDFASINFNLGIAKRLNCAERLAYVLGAQQRSFTRRNIGR